MIYEFICPACNHKFEEIYALTELHSSFPTTRCPICSAIARRLYSPPGMILDLPPYFDAGLGRYINSRQERTQVMRELGVTECGTEKLDLGKIERKKERERAKQEENLKCEAIQMMNALENK